MYANPVHHWGTSYPQDNAAPAFVLLPQSMQDYIHSPTHSYETPLWYPATLSFSEFSFDFTNDTFLGPVAKSTVISCMLDFKSEIDLPLVQSNNPSHQSLILNVH